MEGRNGRSISIFTNPRSPSFRTITPHYSPNRAIKVSNFVCAHDYELITSISMYNKEEGDKINMEGGYWHFSRILIISRLPLPTLKFDLGLGEIMH